jgi:hypothetical protein
LTEKIEESKKKVEDAEKEAKATIVTLPGGKEEVEKVEKKQEEEKKEEKATSTSTIGTTVSGKTKTSTGKPIAPPVPAPKPKEEKEPKEGEKPKPVPVPVSPTKVINKKLYENGEEFDDEAEDESEPSEVSVTEVPGGEAQIQKEVTDNTLEAH